MLMCNWSWSMRFRLVQAGGTLFQTKECKGPGCNVPQQSDRMSTRSIAEEQVSLIWTSGTHGMPEVQLKLTCRSVETVVHEARHGHLTDSFEHQQVRNKLMACDWRAV